MACQVIKMAPPPTWEINFRSFFDVRWPSNARDNSRRHLNARHHSAKCSSDVNTGYRREPESPLL